MSINEVPLQNVQVGVWCAVGASRNHHHHHRPPWIRSFVPFWYRRIAIISWGAHDLLFLEVCSWGCVSAVWCCPFFQGGWSSFVCIWVSCLVFHSVVYPVTLLTKRISAASRPVMSMFTVTHVSLPYSRLPTFCCHTAGYPRFAAIQPVTHVSLPYSRLPTFCCHTALMV